MRSKMLVIGVLLSLTGCIRPPLSPTVAVMPGPGKPFDLFAQEEQECRDYAKNQIGMDPAKAELDNGVAGAAAGTLIGAAAGTAIGAVTHNIGAGAVVGGGVGLAEGTAIGTSNGYGTAQSLQRRYNIAYEQCMYAKGNQVPGAAPRSMPPPMPPPPGPNAPAPRY